MSKKVDFHVTSNEYKFKLKEEFEETKGVIRCSKSKTGRYGNGQKENDKRTKKSLKIPKG